MNCTECNKELTGKQSKFCSVKCKKKYFVKEHNCEYCDTLCRNRFCNQTCKAKQNRKLQVENGTAKHRTYKLYLIDVYGEKCMECGWCERNTYTGNIPIELEHIDGNNSNNDLTNLKLLCPNHHSLTPTYKGANRGNGPVERRERYQKDKLRK